ncbi:putative ribonuclease H-like domain-containing protein [Tanacetum coccineum]
MFVTTPAVPATEDSPAVPEQTTVETVTNMTPENRAHYESEKEAIHLILTGIGDEIYSTVDACQTAQEMWEAIERLQQEWSRFVTIVKQQHKLDEVSYHKLFDILKQYQKEVNELRAERMAKNANPLSLCLLLHNTLQEPILSSSKSHKSYAHQHQKLTSQRSDPEQAQRDKDMQKNFGSHCKVLQENLQSLNQQQPQTSLITPETRMWILLQGQQVWDTVHNCKEFGHYAKECRKPKRVKDSTYHKEKMLLYKQAKKGVQLEAEQSDWLADTDEEIDKQELEAHYSYMAKIKMETGDSNVIPDSPDMCDNDDFK